MCGSHMPSPQRQIFAGSLEFFCRGAEALLACSVSVATDMASPQLRMRRKRDRERRLRWICADVLRCAV